MVVAQAKKHSFPNHPFRLVAFFTLVMRCGASLHRDVGASGYPPIVAQTIVRQLVSKVQHINLIGALTHIALPDSECALVV
jgi:hypothetical protein